MTGKFACFVGVQYLIEGSDRWGTIIDDFKYRNKSVVVDFDKKTVSWDRGPEYALTGTGPVYITNNGKHVYSFNKGFIKHIKINKHSRIELHLNKCISGPR